MENLFIIKNKFKEIKITNISISKIISKIIKWYQIFAIKILKKNNWIINKNLKFIVKSNEKNIYSWIKQIKKIIIKILLIYILLLLILLVNKLFTLSLLIYHIDIEVM